VRRIGTVMLTRKGGACAERAVRALAAQACDQEIVLSVVVQGESEPLVERLQVAAGGHKVSFSEAAPGEPWAIGANAGAATLDADVLLFLDDDTELAPGALGALLSRLNQDESLAMVGPMLVYPTGQIDQAGQSLPLWLVPMAVGRDAPSTDHRFGFPRDAFAVSTSCLVVRRSSFESAGRFHEGYAWGFEAADLALSVRENGGRVLYEPRSICQHEGGLTIRDDPALSRVADNRSLFLQRWGLDLWRQVGDFLERRAGHNRRELFIYGTGEAGRHLANTLEVGGFEVGGFLGDTAGRIGAYEGWAVDDAPAACAERVLIGTPYVRDAEDRLSAAGLLAGAILPILVE